MPFPHHAPSVSPEPGDPGSRAQAQGQSAFVKSIIAAESRFEPDALSPKGAIGLMQLMPATAREWGADPAVAEQNVEAGTHYLSWLMCRYGHWHNQLISTIAAYNAGASNVERYHGVPPFRETKAYVARVLRYSKCTGPTVSTPTKAPLPACCDESQT
ncbi:MAG: lytic transglycosylase domain-containing protein [Terriglobales bacterium]